MLSSMHKLFFCILLVGLSLTAAPLFAQQSFNPYQPINTRPQANPAGPNYQPPLRWRPLESETEDAGSFSDRRASNPHSTAHDYTDEPFGLPRGTYRSIEQRHTITPHHEGFRFRPIDPGEQLRNRERNQSSAQRQDDLVSPVAPHNGFPAGYQQGLQAPALKFRPDARLDKETRGRPSGYVPPIGNGSQMFRPRRR